MQLRPCLIPLDCRVQFPQTTYWIIDGIWRICLYHNQIPWKGREHLKPVWIAGGSRMPMKFPCQLLFLWHWTLDWLDVTIYFSWLPHLVDVTPIWTWSYIIQDLLSYKEIMVSHATILFWRFSPLHMNSRFEISNQLKWNEILLFFAFLLKYRKKNIRTFVACCDWHPRLLCAVILSIVSIIISSTHPSCFNLDGRVEGFEGALVQLLAVLPKL